MGKLSHDGDLLEELTDVCKKENVVLGTLEAIGAVQKTCIGYHNQQERKYQFSEIKKHLEIASLLGISAEKTKKIKQNSCFMLFIGGFSRQSS